MDPCQEKCRPAGLCQELGNGCSWQESWAKSGEAKAAGGMGRAPELAKHTSAGKPQVQDIDPLFILAMGNVLTQGLTKYPNDEDGLPNWWKGGDYRDFVGSIQRHTARLASGEEFDSESGEPHAAHIAVDAMFIWSWMSRGVGRDTRLVTPQTLEVLFNSALERGCIAGRQEARR